jgi:hypothetical protein
MEAADGGQECLSSRYAQQFPFGSLGVPDEECAGNREPPIGEAKVREQEPAAVVIGQRLCSRIMIGSDDDVGRRRERARDPLDLKSSVESEHDEVVRQTPPPRAVGGEDQR